MIVTNGAAHQVWHLTGGLLVVAVAVDLLSEDSLAAKSDALFYLSKEAIKRRLPDELWHKK